MSWEYITKVGGVAADKASLGVFVIEFFVLLIIYVIWFYQWLLKRQKSPPNAESVALENPGRWNQIWRFVCEDKKRIGVVTFLFVGFYVFFYAPYELYEKDHNEINGLQKQTNILSLRLDWDAAELHEFDKIPAVDLAYQAVREFDKGNYGSACILFRRYFSSGSMDNRELTMKPLYFCATLKTNHANNGIYSPEALGQFEGSFKEMTNEIGIAVTEHLPRIANDAENLRQTLENIDKAGKRIPDSEANLIKEVRTT